MEFTELLDRALAVRQLYAEFETKTFGRSWTREELMLGYVGDIGDLAKLVTASEGVRNIADVEQKLAHEFADCLWSILVLAHLHGVDLQTAFLQTMDDLEQHIRTSLAA